MSGSRGRRSAAPSFLAAAVLASLLAACGAGGGGGKAGPRPPALGSRPVLVVDGGGSGTEPASWVRLIRAGGYAATELGFGYLSTNGAAVVPDGVHLSTFESNQLVSWVRSGGRLVTADGAVLGRLGARLGRPEPASGANMEGLQSPAVWAQPVSVSAIEVASGTASSVLASARVGSSAAIPVAVRWGYGRGEVLGLGVDPLGAGRLGYELFPTLARMVAAVTGAPPGPSRQGLELYLDPGILPPSIERNVDAVANLAEGARVVDIAAWDSNFSDPSSDYPYQALIEALHARGILAYAWLEPPFVDLNLWQNHPECREKTETGQDAHVFWRYLISLETPACFSLAWQEWKPVLTGNAWDGVNVAELYFEPPVDPHSFTPFSAGAMQLFGRDPNTDRAAFMDFRTALVTRLNRQMLQYLNGLPGAASLDFELTVIDSELDPTEARNIGTDLSQLAPVARANGASLQIEDPFTTWSEGPLRYDRITAELKSMVDPGNGLIDLNVVDRPGARPTTKMTGGELDLAAQSAAAFTGRLAAYALGTIPAGDLSALPAAMAASVRTTYTGIVAPWTVIAHAPAGTPGTELTVDGLSWPTAGGVAVVPAGEHRLAWSGGPPVGPGLTGFSGEISSASTGPAAMTIGYFSRPAAYAVVSAEPRSLVLDGAAAALSAQPDPAGGWSVRLPSGTHHVTLTF